jgi:protein TonB
MKNLLFIVFWLLSLDNLAQIKPVHVIDSIITEPPPEIINEEKEDNFWMHGVAFEVAPQYKGGLKAMKKYFYNNLQYPKAAKILGIHGKVFVYFIVSNTGKIENIKILNGLGYGCDEEAIRVLKKMPDWLPGKQGGKTISVRYHLPIAFPPDEYLKKD